MGSHLCEGLAGPALIPLNKSENLLPTAQMRRKDRIRTSRPPMDNQQNGIETILTADSNPLLDASNPHIALLHYAVRTINPQARRYLRLPNPPLD
jgi:hypothetical protein